MAAPRYWMGFAPVPLTSRVGLAALLVTVNFTRTRAPVASANPDSATVFAAVAAAVEQVA
ncbi:MAG: hypothetical protein ACLU6O_13695 [Bilophila wadsworthia]